VTDNPVHRDDIQALRREDDLSTYMRSLIRPTKTPASTPKRRRKITWGAIPKPPDHKPGQWPPGTSPPGPAPERGRPAADWDQAVNDYRATNHQPDEEQT
jgi:hypothetical protein